MTQENNTEQTTQSLEFGASCTAPVFYRVAVPSPLRRAFDYLPPKVGALAAQPGTRIRIPFGARKVTGVILDIVTETDVPPAKLRHADSVLDAAPLLAPNSLPCCAGLQTIIDALSARFSLPHFQRDCEPARALRQLRSAGALHKTKQVNRSKTQRVRYFPARPASLRFTPCLSITGPLPPPTS